MMSFYLFPVLLAMLLGGESSLSGYLEPALYWHQREIVSDLDTLSALLVLPEVNGEKTEEWVAQLGAERFAEREAASLALSKMGDAARPALDQAAKSRDPEVSQRAKRLLKSLQPADEEQKRLDQLMALYSLARMASPEAQALLRKVAEGPDAEWQALARRLLQTTEVMRLSQSNLEVLSAFPETTTGFMQLRPETYASAWAKAIRASATMQEILVKVIALTGDIDLQRMTLGVNANTFLESDGKLQGRIELRYDTEKLKTALLKTRFKAAAETDEKVILTSGPLALMLVDERNILFVMEPLSRNEIQAPKEWALLKGTGEGVLSAGFKDLMTELPEQAMFRAAWLVPEKLAAKVDALAGVEKVIAHGNRKENGIGAEMVLLAKDPAAAEKARDYCLKQINETKTLLANEDLLNVRPYMDFFEKVQVMGEEGRVKIQAELQIDVMQAFLNQVEQTQQRMQINRNQMQQRMMRNQVIF